METVEFLGNVSLFENSTAEEIISIAKVTRECAFDPGEPVIRQGERSDCLYVIRSGAVSVMVDDRELARLEQGQCVGEVGVVDTEPRCATAVALEPVRALNLKHEDFFEIINSQPNIARGVIPVLVARLREMDRDVKPDYH